MAEETKSSFLKEWTISNKFNHTPQQESKMLIEIY